MNDQKEMIHFNLDLSPELNDTLEQMAKKIGGSKTDVLRQAIALMQIVVTAKEQGRKFGIAEENQPLATEILIP
ncbi:MAG: DNA-binding protein [Microcoleus anatoxicus]|uniref:DNA-binding protein n=2 Tax=Microcoleaceae TaxID=1892252 RepID=A0A2G4EZU0_9CYAN|nr:DNA-binding protein [Tychonema bourrellyi]MDQ2097129.1 DNA-binding protein [Tychonema bourrellyi B0820]TAD89184.1 MAG: DNA-binding protein [Oscillatoriales cyanobacterium]PHX55022.1 DNA-binding protein [Tychonema bourrellyi FEM_GT703]TAD98997.1 MAG: DNA-binding protein [Oscillatoriales cyanobacterium]TAE05347.1 MAG: DNA-binding protein [Oscillatoriales cyanobacterium]